MDIPIQRKRIMLHKMIPKLNINIYNHIYQICKHNNERITYTKNDIYMNISNWQDITVITIYKLIFG
jgi:superoxide dismutase